MRFGMLQESMRESLGVCVAANTSRVILVQHLEFLVVAHHCPCYLSNSMSLRARPFRFHDLFFHDSSRHIPGWQLSSTNTIL